MDKIRLRQLLCVTFLVALAMKMFMLPVLVMRESGRDGFTAMLIALGVDLVVLAVVAAVLHVSEKDLFATLSDAFGGIVSRVVVALFALVCLLKLLLVLVDVKMFFSTSVFGSELGAFYILPFLLAAAYLAVKPLSVTGRLAELLAPAVVVSMVLLGALTLPEVDFAGLMPMVGEGWGKVSAGVLPFGAWYGDLSLLLLFAGKTTGCGARSYLSLIAAAVAMALLMTFATVLFASYGDMTEVLTYGHNISNMTQFAVGSYRFGRFDLLIFCVWQTGVALSAGLMAGAFVRCSAFVVGRKASYVLCAAACAGYVVILLIVRDLNRIVELAMDALSLPSAIVQCALPPLALIAAGVCKAKRRKHEKTVPQT